MSNGVPCTFMRGGTSKGTYFLSDDVPTDQAERDAFLLRVMGSPDPRQIDGMGGADPLTSKVAIVSKSSKPGVDVDYLFLQVFVDQALVSTSQNCGNILAGIAAFAIDKRLVKAKDPVTDVTINMVNSDQIAVATIETPKGVPTFEGDTAIDGVPGTAAPVLLDFKDVAGGLCGALLPTGRPVDEVDGVPLTLIDNGMPVVVMRADDFGITGYEAREGLDADDKLKARIEAIRLKVGPMMNLGDVKDQSVPKMILVAPPKNGGVVMTRSFIPHRCHASIGVFAALSVATACLYQGSPGAQLAAVPAGARKTMAIEHPTGQFGVVMETSDGPAGLEITKSAFVRTARKLFEGQVFV